jgi:hypothetical protein
VNPFIKKKTHFSTCHQAGGKGLQFAVKTRNFRPYNEIARRLKRFDQAQTLLEGSPWPLASGAAFTSRALRGGGSGLRS